MNYSLFNYMPTYLRSREEGGILLYDKLTHLDATRGFVVCAAAEATADGYALVDGTMTHGSRFYLDVWSSKRGPNIRMTHPRYGLTPSVGYGNVVVSFKPHPTLTTAEAEPVTVSASGSGGEADTEAAAKITSLVEHSTEEFSILADSFDKNWDAWQKSWKNPKLIEFSSSSVFANGPEWDALVKMSTAILPQVVKKLQTTSNIFGCNLCECSPLSSHFISSLPFHYLPYRHQSPLTQLTHPNRQQAPNRPQKESPHLRPQQLLGP
jgi:hypothetical protein